MTKRSQWSPFGIANALTIIRILVIPLFVWVYHHGYGNAKTASTSAAWYYLGALAIFGLASFTDFLDGRIARQRGVTELGKFLDPIADKLLVLATLLAFKYWGDLIPVWMILIFAVREIGVTLLRSALVARGERVISASQWGKFKTISQMSILVASMLLLGLNSMAGYPIEQVHTGRGPIFWMMLVPMALTVISGAEFLYNNRDRFRALASRGQ
ncbi:MAG: CDP-diacylglycerol--glycerol-3-phosphate 3-phosphatidyltransferase [Candidatus Poribacteria bacterium]|nr:CDP-diacylglycerol--glycerol-3-phosphate 3-phosphatidyltransferase [Candidatus Poribacteria bacterium]